MNREKAPYMMNSENGEIFGYNALTMKMNRSMVPFWGPLPKPIDGVVKLRLKKIEKYEIAEKAEVREEGVKEALPIQSPKDEVAKEPERIENAFKSDPELIAAMKSIPKDKWTNLGPPFKLLRNKLNRKISQQEYVVALQEIKDESR